MMDFFGKKEKKLDMDDYVEMQAEPEADKSVNVMIDRLENYAAVDRVIKKVREGNIVIVKIKDLKDMDLDELKQAVSKLRTVTSSIKGDIVGVSDEWLLITPPTVRIER